MALENRNGRLYYYRKRREGKRVISEYVGGGHMGELAEIFDNADRWEVTKQRIAFQDRREGDAVMDRQAREVEKLTQAFIRAALLLAGYHAPRRQWRKRRDG